MPTMERKWYVTRHLPTLVLQSHFDDTQGTSEEAAKDITAFVAIFFEHFSKFKGRPFHMAGESYGVRERISHPR